MARLPRSIKIVVHDGRNLDYRVAGSKKTPQTRRWRVIFIGGEKKLATGIVDEQDGFPRWDCEVLITPPKPVETVRMLVVDGKEREIGQVVITLSDLPWPPTPPPSLVTSQLHVRELQPTKHNPTPCGQLAFWIWATDYWPEGTIPIANSSGGHGAKNAIKGSLSHLGAAIKSSQHGSVVTSQSGGGDIHSRTGGKFRDIKKRNKDRSSASYISGSGLHSQRQFQQQDEASVLMGASIISSHAGLAPTVGGWTSAASELTGGIAPEGNLVNGISYNPLALAEQDEREACGDIVGAPSSMFVTGGTTGNESRVSEGKTLNNADNVWSTAAISPPSTGAPPTMREGKSRRRHVVDHLKSKLSRSSANLSEFGHKIRSRRSSPDGSRCEQDFKVPLNESVIDGTPPQMRPDTRPIVRRSEHLLEPNSQFAGNMVKEEWSLPSTQPPQTATKPPIKPSVNGNSSVYGLHPEEGPGKSKEDMSKRELIELTNVLEERLIATRTELVRANMEQNQLSARVEDLNSELVQTRLQLSNLRSRLLEDNLTQYLEVSGTDNPPVRALRRPEQLTTFHSPNASPPGGNVRSPENSFLSKAKALASRSFGGGVLSGAASQPNLSNPGLSVHNSLSPPSPARNGVIDYGSVW